MQSVSRGLRLIGRCFVTSELSLCQSLTAPIQFRTSHNNTEFKPYPLNLRSLLEKLQSGQLWPTLPTRYSSTVAQPEESVLGDSSAFTPEMSPRIKFKRLDKTARHIMQILDKEAVEKVRTEREIADIKPGYIIQLKVEVPENKRRVSIMNGIVIARRNAGLNSTFRLRRMVAGVGIESVFPLYSPNIKEVKVLEKKRVRRAKLYYLRDQMNALNK